MIVADDTGGIVGKLDALNIPVLYFLDDSVKNVDDVLAQIGLLGQITASNEKAATLVGDLGTRVTAVEDSLQGVGARAGPKAVYHELDPGFFTVSDDTFIGDLYRLLHVRNIAGGGGGQAYPQLTQEAILDANPNVIILADEAAGVTVDSVKARPGWDVVDAVQNDRIYVLDTDIISRPGPRIVDALEELARLIHPDRFS